MKPGTRTSDFSSPAPRRGGTSKRQVKRSEPFSPWQVLVENRRMELGLSTRALADAISSGGKRLEHTTVWAWLRSPVGYPPKETYDVGVNMRLAKALSLRPDRLAEAYEESRRHFQLAETATAQQGPLSVLRVLFAESSRKTWKTEEIVKLIDQVRGQ